MEHTGAVTEEADPPEVIIRETRADFTSGAYRDEATSALAFDAIVSGTRLFNSHPEVWGEMVQPRMGQEFKRMRIDRILTPTKELRDAGWDMGPIGVELKKSGVKIGPVLAQAGDYLRSVWQMPHGYNVMLDFVAIWPIEKQHGTTASFMMQNRIGAISSSRWKTLRITCGERVLLDIPTLGRMTVSCKNFGRKAGSR